MQYIRCRNFLLLSALIVMISSSPVNGESPGYSTTQKIPQGFSAFVPKDYKTGVSQTTTGPNAAGVSFVATKSDPKTPAILHEYRLKLDMRVTASQLIKMQGPIYQAQLENDIESKRKSYAASKSGPGIRYDQATVTKYPWGYGITQRRVHHYIGSGTGPDETEYMCEYIGLIVDDTSVKKFELLVGGIESSAEADQWAKNVVVKIGKTTLANIRDL
jgi:hypothetical protein